MTGYTIHHGVNSIDEKKITFDCSYTELTNGATHPELIRTLHDLIRQYCGDCQHLPHSRGLLYQYVKEL